MRRRKVIALLFVMTAFRAAAQFSLLPQDARGGSMGGVNSLLFDPERKVEVGFRNEFATAGMSTMRIGAMLPLGEGWARLSYSKFGDVDYAEHRAVAGYGLRVADGFSVGVEGGMYALAVGDGRYPTQRWLGGAVAAKAVFSPRLWLTAVAGTRPWDAGRGWRMLAAMAYRPVNRFLTVVEVESEDRWRLRLGMEYSYRQHFFFRAGMSTAPLVLTAGVGVFYGRYALDVGMGRHPVLGISPQLTLVVCF